MREFQALLVDFGGVLTSSIFDSFGHFCESVGLPRDAVSARLREDPAAARLLRDVETGELPERAFEAQFARLLSADADVDLDPADLIARLTATLEPDVLMLEAVGAIREAGCAVAIVSNSFGYRSYDGYALSERVDHVILSGDIGIRKPSRRIYLHAAETVGVSPDRCVFVDDLEQNLVGAERVGMTGVLHEHAPQTLVGLERLLGIRLGGAEVAPG
jgi:putative hydrolase of the HAD superfamily